MPIPNQCQSTPEKNYVITIKNDTHTKRAIIIADNLSHQVLLPTKRKTTSPQGNLSKISKLKTKTYRLESCYVNYLYNVLNRNLPQQPSGSLGNKLKLGFH